MSQDNIDTHIGLRLLQWRKRKKLSQKKVGEVIGISPQQLARYESGQSRITATNLYYLARALDQPVSWFFGGIDVTYEQKQHMEIIIQEPLPDKYYSSNSAHEDDSLIALWHALSKDNQRQKVKEMLEAFVT